MALLERVMTLVRANLNDLVDRAEHPEKMLKQVILDMQNQLMQVKTQVAIALADQHLLARKRQENEDAAGTWLRKAELAVEKKEDALARAAVERALACRQTAENFREQQEDQEAQVETLKNALRRLEQKLAEAQSRKDVLVAEHRRARAVSKGVQAGTPGDAGAFDRMKEKVHRQTAVAKANAELAAGDTTEQLAALAREDEIQQVLLAIKSRKALS